MAIAPETFLRKALLAITASGSASWWRMLIYLVRIPRCQGRSVQSDVLRRPRPPHQRRETSCPKQEGSQSARGGSDRTTVAESFLR
jgi:hypothetical protein